MNKDKLTIEVVGPENWGELESFFEGHGNPNYCWCMLWRLSSSDYRNLESRERRSKLMALVGAGKPVGIIAKKGGQPVGWCSVAPRDSYGRLQRSRTIRPIDDRKVWSIVCLFLTQAMRGLGYSGWLIRAAVDYALAQEAEVVEAYPVEPQIDDAGHWQHARSYRFMGYRTSYEKAGFVEITPEGANRPIMRYEP